MSCISVTHKSLGGMWCSSQTLGGIDASAYTLGGISASSYTVGGISVTVTRRSGIRVRMWQECRTNIGAPYLEIDPTIVWVLNGWTSNDVYSNTTWNVD